MAKTFILALCVLVFAMATGHGADEAGAGVTDSDRAAIEQVIRNQIAAFQRDDAHEAFGYASPGIRAQFGTAERFMGMVRSGYRPVYRPRSVAFGETRVISGIVVQEVFVVGPLGQAWVALYPMERQPDGTWKIAGCTLTRRDGTAAWGNSRRRPAAAAGRDSNLQDRNANRLSTAASGTPKTGPLSEPGDVPVSGRTPCRGAASPGTESPWLIAAAPSRGGRRPVPKADGRRNASPLLAPWRDEWHASRPCSPTEGGSSASLCNPNPHHG